MEYGRVQCWQQFAAKKDTKTKEEKKINGIVWLDSWSVSRAFGYYALFMGAQTSMNIH